MSDTKRPPFRADHVGSLLRPPELLDARAKRQAGAISAAALREVEDRSIREAVAMQESIGLRGITDGEFRRTYFHIDFLEQIEGIAVRGGIAVKFHRHDKEIDFAPPRLEVVGKLRRPRPIAGADFDFLKSATRQTAKLCIPSPTMVHFRGGRAAVDRMAYPDMEEFFFDLAGVYREEIADLAAAAPICSSTTPISPISATRSCGRVRATAATIRTSCRISMRASSTMRSATGRSR
jgi:methionine synthase II (cobalamin-independent)